MEGLQTVVPAPAGDVANTWKKQAGGKTKTKHYL